MAQGGVIQGGGISWNKLFAFASIFGIPLISLAIWVAIYGTRLVVKVESIQIAQTEQGNDIKSIKNFMYSLSKRVDTIAQVQKDDKKDFDYKMELQSMKYITRDGRLVTERYINGKLTFIPVR